MKNNIKNETLSNNYHSLIFTKIYEENQWGGHKGDYYSGPGSHNNYIPDYADKVANLISRNKLNKIIEIGCGDFNVTKQILKNLDKQKVNYKYIGYEVVKALVLQNTTIYGSSAVKFVFKDPCFDDISGGDILIIRQVLQHLDNQSIKKSVAKFQYYKFIVITEHQPIESLSKKQHLI